MQRIHLTKHERTVFRKTIARCELPPVGMEYDVYFAALVALHQKNLLNVHFNYDKVLKVEPTRFGLAYYAMYPDLHNPIDWQLLTFITTAITAIAAVAALFISCI